MRIAWITDSTANLTNEFMKEHDIYSVPVQIIIDGTQYRDGVDLTEAQLYEKLAAADTIPTTSQPAIGDFVHLYESLKNKYDGAIAIHISAALSGTYATSQLATEMTNFPVTMVDSQLLSEPMAVLIRYGKELLAKGSSLEEVAAALERKRASNETYVIVGQLDQLYRSGRLKRTQYYVGSLLQIKPIISLSKGKLTLTEKIRTEKKAWQRMLDKLEDAKAQHASLKDIYILHVQDVDRAELLKQFVLSVFPELTIHISELSSAVGVHTGKGTLAISWFNDH